MNSFPCLLSRTIPMVILFLTAFAINSSAQRDSKCRADQIYFVASGQMVMDVYPGSNSGNGYQLNIIGAGADQFEVIQEPYLATVYVIPGYTNSTQAKWQIHFAQGFERVICSITMKNKCSGETRSYPLTVGVRLFNK